MLGGASGLEGDRDSEEAAQVKEDTLHFVFIQYVYLCLLPGYIRVSTMYFDYDFILTIFRLSCFGYLFKSVFVYLFICLFV